MKTFKHKPITLFGETRKRGDIAPDFRALNSKGEFMSLSDFKARYIIINVVPSLDTTVCDRQTRTVNTELVERDDLTVLTVSNDLPYAQARWCGNAGLKNVITLSDYLEFDFGKKYGTLIKEYKLLARSIFVLNEKREIIYLEYVDEMSQHLNYDELIAFVRNMPKD